MGYVNTWRLPLQHTCAFGGFLGLACGSCQQQAPVCSLATIRSSLRGSHAPALGAVHAEQTASSQALDNLNATRTSWQEETGSSYANATSSPTQHKPSVQHLLEQCDLIFQELSSQGQTPSQLCASVQQLAEWCEDVRWPGPQALLRHRLAQHITFTIPYYLPDFRDEETVALLEALAQLDRQNVSSDVHECLQHVHSSFAERGCSGLSTDALCKDAAVQALSSYASSPQLQRIRGHIIAQLVQAVLPLTDQLSPTQQCAVAADLCWLRQDRQHRPAIAKLFTCAVRHAALLGPRQIGQLFYAARCLGRMPELQMLELAGHLPAVVGQLTAMELVTVEDALFRSGVRDKSLLHLLDVALAPKVDSLGERQLSRSMYLFASMGYIPSAQLLVEVERLIFSRPQQYSCRSLSTLLWAWVRFGWHPQPALLQAVAATLDQQARSAHGQSDLTPRNLATVIWCYGSLHYAPPNLQSLCKAMELRLGGCNAYDLSQLMYGLGAMHDGRAKLPASLLRSVERQACSMIGSFLPQGLAQTVWSYGKLLVPAPALMSAAVQAATQPDSGWKGRDFSDLLWGCARLGHQEPAAAFQVVGALIATALQEHPDKWSLPDLALLAWSCASLPSALSSVVEEIAALLTHSPERLSSATSLDVSLLLWAIAQVDVAAAPSLLQAFTAQVQQIEGDALPRERCSIMWAYGKLRCYPGERLTDLLLTDPARNIGAYEPVAICNVMYACGALRHDPGQGLLEAVENHILAHGEQYTERDWLRILWAYGTLGQRPSHAASAFQELMARGMMQLDGSLASMGMWALAVNQDFESPLFRILTASLAQFHHSALDTAALQRIHHAHLLACSLGKAKLQDVPSPMRIAAQKSWQVADAAATTRPMGAVRAVATTLKGMGLACTTGVASEDGHFVLHLLLEEPAKDGRPIVIEMVPSIKMLRNTGAYNGHVLLHLANLRARGYAVLPISCPDWRAFEMLGSPAVPSDGLLPGMRNPFQSVEDAREQFLAEKLSEHLPRFARSDPHGTHRSQRIWGGRDYTRSQQLPPIRQFAAAVPV